MQYPLVVAGWRYRVGRASRRPIDGACQARRAPLVHSWNRRRDVARVPVCRLAWWNRARVRARAILITHTTRLAPGLTQALAETITDCGRRAFILSRRIKETRTMEIKALVFDVFGTVVDWRTAVIDELRALGERHGVAGDWVAFADAWKAAYRPGLEQVNNGALRWTNVDVIFRRRLDELLRQYGLASVPEEERDHLNRVWCRPNAWPDAVPGLTRLKTRHVLATLSNGNFAWLVAIARHCGLPFDCILTAENCRRYKPAPETYRMAIELLAQPPECLLMVASHNYDLAAARSHGMRTAFFPRRENGPTQTTDQAPEQAWDFVVDDLEALAAALGC